MKVIFEDGDLSKKVVGLWQWDYGQSLEIYGLSLPDQVEIHFAAGVSCKALICLGTTQGGVTKVQIPDELLQTGQDIRAYVYVADTDSGETVRTITLPVNKRPKPEDYTAPAEKNLLRQMGEKLDAKADDLLFENGMLQLSSNGTGIGTRVRLPSGGGGGREIELRNNGTAIQWRYTDSNEWTDLVRLGVLASKAAPDFEIRDNHLIVIYPE